MITPIIMAGGSGTRLWPVSRDTMPKQFVSLLPGGLSTFQQTVLRVSGAGFAAPIVVTNNDFRFVCAEQLAQVGVTAEIVLEPARRDSAPAVAVGTRVALMRDEAAICLALAADHVVDDDPAFVADCARAANVAAIGRIVTLGIRPDHPSSAYGYLQLGSEFGADGAFVLERFVEKPDTETAQAYIEKGYLWNSGNFCYAAQTMIGEFERFCPEVLAAADRAVDASLRDLDFLRLDEAAFRDCPAISVDYAIMEKTDRGATIAASFGWSDVGSWDALHKIRVKDDDRNVIDGPVVVMDTTDSLVLSEGLLTTVIGLTNIVVVTTSDAVLVADMAASAKVKTLVADLKQRAIPEASEHVRIHRPWGWYQRIDIGPRFQVKHIMVKPGGKLSLQRHYHRAEHWVVVQGSAEVTIDQTVKMYHENEAAYLPIGCVHRLHNPGKIDLKIIEIQVGSYTGEDDIVRMEDIYARN